MNYLKNERERLKLTAADVYEKIAAGRSTYARWEGGAPIPSDKLSELSKIGFDIQYVVTGERSGATPIQQHLDLMHEAYDWTLKFADMIGHKKDITGSIAKPVAQIIYEILADDEDGSHELSAATAMEITSSMREAIAEMNEL